MEEDVAGYTIVRKNEPVALGHVEPFDGAGDFDKVGGIAATVALQGVVEVLIPPRERGPIPPKNAGFFSRKPLVILDIRLTPPLPGCARPDVPFFTVGYRNS